jgi:hypothetical protein
VLVAVKPFAFSAPDCCKLLRKARVFCTPNICTEVFSQVLGIFTPDIFEIISGVLVPCILYIHACICKELAASIFRVVGITLTDPEIEGSTFIRNVSVSLRTNTASVAKIPLF